MHVSFGPCTISLFYSKLYLFICIYCSFHLISQIVATLYVDTFGLFNKVRLCVLTFILPPFADMRKRIDKLASLPRQIGGYLVCSISENFKFG